MKKHAMKKATGKLVLSAETLGKLTGGSGDTVVTPDPYPSFGTDCNCLLTQGLTPHRL